jgi:hypothetical protein
MKKGYEAMKTASNIRTKREERKICLSGRAMRSESPLTGFERKARPTGYSFSFESVEKVIMTYDTDNEQEDTKETISPRHSPFV